MAEWIVNSVLGKLADVTVQEVLSLHGVEKQVETMTRELGRIQAFLKDADKKRIIDDGQKYWIKEVRDLAYSIEDAIDTFLTEIPQEPQNSTGMMQDMKRMIKKAKKYTHVHKLVDDISVIQTKMKEIRKSRLSYGINKLGEDSGEIQLPIRPFVLPDIDPEIIGFNKDRDHIVKGLLDETTKRRSVVSIWGTGGLGKTTLAQKVYNSNDVKERFRLRIWIVISQKFKLIDILGNILQQLDLHIDPSKLPKDEVALLAKLRESLRDKNYLVVFDDVWTDDLWIQIESALPDENNGSRVLLTSRSFDVVKNADPTCEPYKLEYLTDDLSLKLLLKKALPNQDPNNSAFHDLSEIMNKFVKKCDGLPLALVVVGGLLSKKPCNYNAWSKVLKTMCWDNDGKKCSEIISTSYEDLPFALKSCFMYFAAFPEDYEVNVKDLIRIWVAEGFIPQENNRTLEETAESFLEDLLQRSMIHVKSRSHDGSIKYCRIHDLLRDLAIRKAKEDNFLMVYSGPEDQLSMGGARRVAVHHLDCDELAMSQNLRTLLYFGNKYMPNCTKQRLLKVVRTDSRDTKIKLKMFEGLSQLRYLNLTGQSRDDKREECLEKAISAMKFLQTLILQVAYQNGDHVEVPDCVWRINTLRHVDIMSFSGVRLTPSTKLTNLQMLPDVIINESWETELPHLPNLRELSLYNESSSWGTAVAFLGTVEHLISLEIFSPRIPLDTFDMRSFPFYQNLQSLVLYQYTISHNEMVDVSMFPPHLTSLQISNYQFHQDVMLVLEKLPCLKKLVLRQTSTTNRKISCSAQGFSKLEVLFLYESFLVEYWKIEEGAMPILRELTIGGCCQLRGVEGLRHLTNLQTLTWVKPSSGGEADEILNLLKDVVPSTVQIMH
ncbi:putative disease resistance RPP13-like protein 3 [Carex rostrata]